MASNKAPIMAHRKRPGTGEGNSMAAPGPACRPTPRPPDSCDLKALHGRQQRPIRYPKGLHEPKPLPRSCKTTYAAAKSQEARRSYPEVDAVGAETEAKRLNKQAESGRGEQRPAPPPAPEQQQEHGDRNRANFQDEADSLDDDSSSDYMNNTSDDEEDYDDGEYHFNNKCSTHNVYMCTHICV